jgi:hypothetical protein
MIYISHPYGGKEENKAKIEQIIKVYSQRYNGEVFISPVHSFGFLYDCLDYERGMELCLELLDRCDSMLVFGDYESSRGCGIEIQFAKDNNIPYQIVGEDETPSRR